MFNTSVGARAASSYGSGSEKKMQIWLRNTGRKHFRGTLKTFLRFLYFNKITLKLVP
jgi:hypothetical protein